MATIISSTDRPKTDDRPVSDKDLSGRYRVVHGDLLVPLETKERDEAVARGLPPFVSLFVGSVVELTHDEADKLLDCGVIEPEDVRRKGGPAPAKGSKIKAAA